MGIEITSTERRKLCKVHMKPWCTSKFCLTWEVCMEHSWSKSWRCLQRLRWWRWPVPPSYISDYVTNICMTMTRASCMIDLVPYPMEPDEPRTNTLGTPMTSSVSSPQMPELRAFVCVGDSVEFITSVFTRFTTWALLRDERSLPVLLSGLSFNLHSLMFIMLFCSNYARKFLLE